MTAPLVAKAPCDVDAIAQTLARCAATARMMPPAWDGAKVMQSFTAPVGGANLGRVLPGKGIALASDLKSLGITKPIPYIFEKSPTMRVLDVFRGRERMAMSVVAALVAAKCGLVSAQDALMGLPLLSGAVTTYDDIINGRANGKGEDVLIYVSSLTTVANVWSSVLRAASKFPAGTFAPAAIPGGTVCNRATTGALSRGLANPGGADKKYLITIGFTSAATINVVMLVDILVAAATILATTTGTQTVDTSALTRYTTGEGNLFTFDVTTGIGTTASNMTVLYTNQAGTTGQSTGAQAMTVSAIAHRLQPATAAFFTPLAAGDYGVRQIEDVTMSAAMSAGIMAAHLFRPLAMLPGVGAFTYVERDSTVQIDGLTELVVGTDSELGCLNAYVLPQSTTSGNTTMFLRTVSG